MDESEQGSAANPPSGPPAGWYSDPNGPNQQRYWNGANWTDQIAPLFPPQVTGPQLTGNSFENWGYVSAVLASLGIIVGSVGPWATSALESVSGTHVDGKYTMAGGVIALILVANRRSVALTMVIAILTVIVGISDISDINNYSVSAFGTEVHPASVGWGLWLTVISGVGLAVGGSRLRSESHRDEEQIHGMGDKTGPL